MKRSIMIAGATFFLSGTLLFGMVYFAIANYVPQMKGWSDPPGKFSLALDATMLKSPLIISVLFMIIGFGLLVLGIYLELMNKKNDTHSAGTNILNGLTRD